MIQPDANADSSNEVSAGKEALDEPLSSLPTDEVGELEPGDLEWLARLEHAFGGRWTHRRARIRRLVGALRQAASTLFRLREERDEALGWRSDRQLALDNLLARALKAEDLNRKLVEGLEKIAGFVRQRPGGDRGSYQRGYDIGFNNAGVTAAEFARRSLLSSISGGEAAGEDGG